jgi:hypothetical protein
MSLLRKIMSLFLGSPISPPVCCISLQTELGNMSLQVSFRGGKEGAKGFCMGHGKRRAFWRCRFFWIRSFEHGKPSGVKGRPEQQEPGNSPVFFVILPPPDSYIIPLFLLYINEHTGR